MTLLSLAVLSGCGDSTGTGGGAGGGAAGGAAEGGAAAATDSFEQPAVDAKVREEAPVTVQKKLSAPIKH